MPGRIVDALSRIPRPPLALAVGAAAVACFGFALLVGWLTAGTKVELQHAKPVGGNVQVAAIPLLGAAAPLPAAPKAQTGAKTPAAPRTPRLIVGSG